MKRLFNLKSVYLGIATFFAAVLLIILVTFVLGARWVEGPLLFLYLLALAWPGYIAARHAGYNSVVHGFISGFIAVALIIPMAIILFGSVKFNGEQMNFNSFLFLSLGAALVCSFGGVIWEAQKYFAKKP